MKKTLCILLFFISGIAFSQNLEEAIYSATETFNESKSETALKQLNKQIVVFEPQLSNIDEHFAFMSLLMNKAYYLDQINRQQQAINTYEDALKHFRTHKIDETYQYDIVEYCLIPLGNLYTKSGDYTNAENTIKQYIFLAEKAKNNRQRISGAINLAQLYFSAGKHKDALKISGNFLQSKGISETQKLKLTQVNTNSQIALKLIADNKDIPTKNEVDIYNLINLETIYNLAIQNKDYEKALVHIHQLNTKQYAEEEISSRNIAKSHFKIAELHYKLNHLDACATELKNALKILLPISSENELPEKTSLYPENTFIDIFDLLARLQTNTQQALNCYNLSFYVSELLTKNLISAEAQLIHLNNNRKRSEACIALLFDAYQKTPDSLIVKRAFEYAEKNKASILKKIIGKKSLLALYPKDNLLLKEQELLTKNERLTNNLIAAQHTKDSRKANAVSIKLTELSTELKEIQNSILKRYPNTESNFELNQLTQKLKQDNAILTEYFYGEYAVYQLIVSATSFSFNKIKRDENFDDNIKKYISFFENPSVINNDISTFKNEAYKLFNLLRFEATSFSENVVVIPDGLLNFIPFESLLTQSTETNNYSKMPFVIHKQRLAYNSSAKFYSDDQTQTKTQNLLGVFPVFDGSNAELKHSLIEAESINKFTNAKFLMHNLATKKAFLDSASNYSILHLSTHASSGTFLEPSHIEFIDETLYLNELYSLNLNPDLVILSACETGIGRLRKGEGSMNLARGFQYAGAKNILFSLWKINDLSTSKIMHQFYENYAETKSAFTANHSSKINYINNTNIKNIKKSPYYWSPFVYYGKLSKPQKRFNSYYIFIGIFCLLIIILLGLKLNRHYGKRT